MANNGGAQTSAQKEDDSALQDVTVINDEDMTAGLPSMYFWGGIVLTAAWVMVFRSVWWLVPPVFALVYYTAMYGIHKDDPRGAQGWVRAVKRAFTWSGGRYKGRRVRFIQERE